MRKYFSGIVHTWGNDLSADAFSRRIPHIRQRGRQNPDRERGEEREGDRRRSPLRRRRKRRRRRREAFFALSFFPPSSSKVGKERDLFLPLPYLKKVQRYVKTSCMVKKFYTRKNYLRKNTLGESLISVPPLLSAIGIGHLLLLPRPLCSSLPFSRFRRRRPQILASLHNSLPFPPNPTPHFSGARSFIF